MSEETYKAKATIGRDAVSTSTNGRQSVKVRTIGRDAVSASTNGRQSVKVRTGGRNSINLGSTGVLWAFMFDEHHLFLGSERLAFRP